MKNFKYIIFLCVLAQGLQASSQNFVRQSMLTSLYQRLQGFDCVIKQKTSVLTTFWHKHPYICMGLGLFGIGVIMSLHNAYRQPVEIDLPEDDPLLMRMPSVQDPSVEDVQSRLQKTQNDIKEEQNQVKQHIAVVAQRAWSGRTSPSIGSVHSVADVVTRSESRPVTPSIVISKDDEDVFYDAQESFEN